MANPNIVNVTEIYGKTVTGYASTINSYPLENPVSSGKVFKVNSIIIANVDGTNSADITCELNDLSLEQTVFLAKTITVPADATLIVLSKDTSIYLEEGDTLSISASANGDLSYIISYEEIG